MSSFAQANAAMREQLRLQHERHHRRRAALMPIHTIDQLIAELEALHLGGRKRVPEAMEPQLQALTAMLPPELRRDLAPRVTIVHLMDRLYAIQDGLFAALGARLPEELDDQAAGVAATSLPEAS